MVTGAQFVYSPLAVGWMEKILSDSGGREARANDLRSVLGAGRL